MTQITLFRITFHFNYQYLRKSSVISSEKKAFQRKKPIFEEISENLTSIIKT
jgi:hypothetical protein